MPFVLQIKKQQWDFERSLKLAKNVCYLKGYDREEPAVIKTVTMGHHPNPRGGATAGWGGTVVGPGGPMVGPTSPVGPRSATTGRRGPAENRTRPPAPGRVSSTNIFAATLRPTVRSVASLTKQCLFRDRG